MSVATAHRLGVSTGGMLQLTYQGRSLRAPAVGAAGARGWRCDAAPGLRPHARRPGGNGHGIQSLRPENHPRPMARHRPGAKKLAGEYQFATTNNQGILEARELDARRHIIHSGAIDESGGPGIGPRGRRSAAARVTLYPEWKYEGHAWGMAIDLTSCMGCSACVVACQAENNIAVVGKDQCAPRPRHALAARGYLLPRRGRQPRAATTAAALYAVRRTRPASWFARLQATNHSSEGLNDMVYNRCVGTRYCSNKLPVQSAAVQFLPVLGLPDAQPEAAA